MSKKGKEKKLFEAIRTKSMRIISREDYSSVVNFAELNTILRLRMKRILITLLILRKLQERDSRSRYRMI